MLSLFRRFSTADTRFCRAERRRENPGIKESSSPAPPKLQTRRVIIVGYGALDIQCSSVGNHGTPPCSAQNSWYICLPLEGKGAKVEKKPCYGFFEVLLTADTWFLTTEWEAKNRSVNADPQADG